jgi:hypothetical protein
MTPFPDLYVLNVTGNTQIVVWRQFNAVKLTLQDRDEILRPDAWLSDDHIDAAQQLIKRICHGEIGGLRPPSCLLVNYGKSSARDQAVSRMDASEMQMQIHHVKDNHWTLSCCYNRRITVRVIFCCRNNCLALR